MENEGTTVVHWFNKDDPSRKGHGHPMIRANAIEWVRTMNEKHPELRHYIRGVEERDE